MYFGSTAEKVKKTLVDLFHYLNSIAEVHWRIESAVITEELLSTKEGFKNLIMNSI